LEASPIPPSVSVEGDMLGKVFSLKFVDHDITDEQKFLELAREKYLCTKSVPGIGAILLETQTWETRLMKMGILNLLEVPHFGCKMESKSFSSWPVSIDTTLIAHITGIPKEGEDPTTLFNNAREKSQSESMKENFHIFRGERVLDVPNINDDRFQFAT
jgi:hypothetical protein